MSFLAVDVGTGSARAAVVANDSRGIVSTAVTAFATRHEPPNFVAQSSGEIFAAVVQSIREAVAAAPPDTLPISGIGVDATCSLVLRGGSERNAPLSALPPPALTTSANEVWDVIVWMDHRAEAEAAAINAAAVGPFAHMLDSVGGRISPEMQIPKLLWLARHAKGDVFDKLTCAMDLADWLVGELTGCRGVRSLCTTTCKWLLQPGGVWPREFFDVLGLSGPAMHVDSIGRRFAPLGQPIENGLSKAIEDSVPVGVPVSSGAIDAHAGALTCLAAGVEVLDGGSGADPSSVLAVIAGTSTCHMHTSSCGPRRVAGVWGPYADATFAGTHLNEAGQSASGAVIDAVVRAGFAALGTPVDRVSDGVARLHDEVLRHAGKGERAEAGDVDHGWLSSAATLTRHVHIGTDWAGNRSPLAEPELRGAVVGLGVNDSCSALAIRYLATLQSLAYGTRHVIEAIEGGTSAANDDEDDDDDVGCAEVSIRVLVVSGGAAVNPLLMQQHADATGRTVLALKHDAMLLGCAAMASCAAEGGAGASLLTHVRRLVDSAGVVSGATTYTPTASPALRRYHDLKYAVYRRMQTDQLDYRAMMMAAADEDVEDVQSC